MCSLMCLLSHFIAIILISQIITTSKEELSKEELLRRRRFCPSLWIDTFHIITKNSYKERVKVFQYANISQADYERAYHNYIVNREMLHEGMIMELRSYNTIDKNLLESEEYHDKYGPVLKHCPSFISKCLYFPIEPLSTEEFQTFTVEHAALRFLLGGDTYSANTTIRMFQFQQRGPQYKTRLYYDVPVMLVDPSKPRWLEYNITETVMIWLKDKSSNLGLELFFITNNKLNYALPISHVKVYIFSRSKITINQFTTTSSKQKRSIPEETAPTYESERIEYSGLNDRCCRQKVDLMFKDVFDIDFIVYPKGYTTGICIGPCPLRDDFTHHDILMQGITKNESYTSNNKSECKPAKWGEVMVIYYDQDDPSLLKVGYWKNVVILDCDCR